MRRRMAAVSAACALGLAACSSSGAGTGSGTSSTSSSVRSSGTSAGTRLSGSLDVLAAASLTSAFTAARAPLVAASPGLRISYDFAGSNTLVTQITQGAPADLFASADTANMDKLVRAGLVDTPVVFARNQHEIAVAPGNPRHVRSLADLARPDLSVVLESVGVPAGDYTRRVLASLHVTVTPRSLETDVKSALTKVASGEADATVVYVTDVRAAGSAVTGVPIPASLQPVINYPIAVVKSTANRAAAEAFVRSAVSGAVQKALEAAGFLPPR